MNRIEEIRKGLNRVEFPDISIVDGFWLLFEVERCHAVIQENGEIKLVLEQQDRDIRRISEERDGYLARIEIAQAEASHIAIERDALKAEVEFANRIRVSLAVRVRELDERSCG